jgi:hypothetical protein
MLARKGHATRNESSRMLVKPVSSILRGCQSCVCMNTSGGGQVSRQPLADRSMNEAHSQNGVQPPHDVDLVCQVCSPEFEQASGVLSKEGDIENNDEARTASKRRFGDTKRAGVSGATTGHLAAVPESKLHLVKRLLLTIEKLIPPSLHRQSQCIGTPAMRGFFGQSLNAAGRVSTQSAATFVTVVDEETKWKETWRSFVKRCCTMKPLRQALIVLLAMLDQSKLPIWWSCPGSGWGDPMAIAGGGGSSFILDEAELLRHISVLKLAIVEYESGGISAPEQFRRTLDCAAVLNVPRFNGFHGYRCYKCDKEGFLLCCELCEGVAHAFCFVPELHLDEDAGFVCDPCILRVRELYLAYLIDDSDRGDVL